MRLQVVTQYQLSLHFVSDSEFCAFTAFTSDLGSVSMLVYTGLSVRIVVVNQGWHIPCTHANAR